MESNWYSCIDDYLDELLPAEKQASMTAAISADPLLAREVQLHRMERQALGILKDDKARAEFQRWTENLTSNAPAPELKMTWSHVRWYVLSAIVAVFVLVFVWLFFPKGTAKSEIIEQPSTEQTPVSQPNPPIAQLESPKTSAPIKQGTAKKMKKSNPPVPSKNEEPIPDGYSDIVVLDVSIGSLYEEPTDVLSRGSSSSTNQAEKKLSEGKNAFERKNYLLAIQLLDQVTSDSIQIYPEAVFVKAHALFQLKKYEKASTVFQLAMTLDSDQKKNAKYMAAVSLFAAGAKDKQKLRQILEELNGNVSPDKQYRVQQMLGKLE